MYRCSSEIWLAGKGPGIDSYNWTGHPRFGINQAAMIIPDCSGAFALDHNILEIYKKNLSPDILVFRRDVDTRWIFPNMYIWNNVEDIHSTAVIAVQILASCGAEKIHFVGFDSIGNGDTKYADSLKDRNWQGTNSDGFKMVNNHLINSIERLGIEPVWEHIET